MTDQNILSGLSEQYRALIGSPKLMHRVFDLHPIPIEIFARTGRRYSPTAPGWSLTI